MAHDTVAHIYARISQEGDRSPAEVEKQLSIYVADAKQRAERVLDGFEYGMIEVESDVSGGAAVADRKLERIILAIEEAGGGVLIIPNAERFARDALESLLATKRILEAGGRILSTDGEDSESESFKLSWGIKAVIAEDYRDKTRKGFLRRIEEAAKEGRWMGSRPPMGYEKDATTGRIDCPPQCEPLLVEMFERAGNGEGYTAIWTWLREAGRDVTILNPKHPKRRDPNEPERVYPFRNITRNAVWFALRNRAYLGEMSVQSGTKGKPRVILNAHRAIITERQWELAQANGQPFIPRDGSTAEGLLLTGLVTCSCGERHVAKAGKIGAGDRKRGGYVVTPSVRQDGTPRCTRTFGISGDALDAFVETALWRAMTEEEPHVAHILKGSTAYEDAMEALDRAKAELQAWITQVSVTDVGRDAWMTGKDARESAVTAARAHLHSIPAPTTKVIDLATGRPLSVTDAIRKRDRATFAKFIRAVEVLPVGKGQRRPVEDRVRIYFHGAETAYVPGSDPVSVPENETAEQRAARVEYGGMILREQTRGLREATA